MVSDRSPLYNYLHDWHNMTSYSATEYIAPLLESYYRYSFSDGGNQFLLTDTWMIAVDESTACYYPNLLMQVAVDYVPGFKPI